MNNTPETEKAERMAYSQEHMVPTEFARKLERERDEAREILQAVIKTGKRLERERDEAREKYATEATEHMLAVNKICNERDEAREDSKATWQSLRDSQDEVLRLTFENRELRNLSNE